MAKSNKNETKEVETQEVDLKAVIKSLEDRVKALEARVF